MGQPDLTATGAWPGAHVGADTPHDAGPPASRRGRRRAPQPSMMTDLAAGARSLGQRARRAPAAVRVAAAVGIVVALAIGTLALTGVFSGPDGAGATPGQSPGSSTAKAPLYDGVKKYSGRGMTLNVPADWTKSGAGTYVDFTDPDGGDIARRVRLNVEAAGGSVADFFKVAEGKTKQNSNNCPTYKRVDMRKVTLDGRDGSELEFTCGEGGEQRHGLWSAVVEDGKAYQFALSVPEADFADSKVIYQEMVRSFALATS
jgi:hypothetical protein